MVDFGGWDMPLQYSGILDEHRAVRTSVGVFDVSHMGEIEIHGAEAGALTDFVSTNAVAKLEIGQAHYSGLLYEHGGFVDDVLVHKIARDRLFALRQRVQSGEGLSAHRLRQPIPSQGGHGKRPLQLNSRSRAPALSKPCRN